MTTFREPTNELPQPFYLSSGRIMLSTEELVDLLVPDAEALLEVLLDICPNAKALAHNEETGTFRPASDLRNEVKQERPRK